jgi:tetratricopeptide (TPR) repeat protein
MGKSTFHAQGLLADNQKLFDTAIVYFKKAIELNNKYAAAYLGLAIVYYEKGEFELEMQNNYLAAQADTANAEAFYYHGTSYEDIGQFDKAIIAYKKSLSLNPIEKDALHDLSLFYLAKGAKNLHPGLFHNSNNLIADGHLNLKCL